ncbi:MAG: N-acetylmuramoyl-L-alanine amidase family protein [Bradymonadia bacterium]
MLSSIRFVGVFFAVAFFGLICPLCTISAQVSNSRQSAHRIVLDPGHGGDNKGAPCGIQHDCFEKDLTLPIAKKTEKHLRSLGAEVYMTRRSDTAVGISDRVQFANQLSADVLVSIHLNASETVGPSGFMTFALSEKGLGEAEARLMKFESLAPVSLKRSTQQRYRSTDLEDLLFDLTINRGQIESVRLADAIQKGLSRASPFPNKGIRQAPFHVLMGAAMPAVVCELGFLNHPEEGGFLRSEMGQDALAKALAEGIISYLNEGNKE